jgi:hypothetical protein
MVQPMPSPQGFTVGVLDAIDPAHGTIRLASATYSMANRALLHGLAVGMRVAVGWDLVDSQRQAQQITGEPPGSAGGEAVSG